MGYAPYIFFFFFLLFFFIKVFKVFCLDSEEVLDEEL